MIIFRDLLTGEELFSDSYKMKLVDDALYEVEGKMTTETSDVSDALIGGNASAEGGGDEGAEASSVSGCDIVLANRLASVSFANKKEYQTYLKKYMAKVIGKLQETAPDRVPAFKAAAQKAAKRILDKYKDFDFFSGESGCPLEVNDKGEMIVNGMVVLMDFREDGVTPYMLFWKDGLQEEKV